MEGYPPLGQVIDELARKRGIIGPQAISQHLWKHEQYDVSDESIHEFMHGYDRPQNDFNNAFKDAFELTEDEEQDYAWAYAYHERQPPD